MKSLLTILSSLALAGNLLHAATGKPNIVLIMADDMGHECVGAHGGLDYKTPVLDQLAKEGLLFKNCHSQPLCTPSRVQLMTGRYNHRNYVAFGKLATTEITFGTLMKNAGYRTCIVGKWQLGGDCSTPHKFGFDEYCMLNGITPRDPFDRKSRGRERYWGYPAIVANGELYESEHHFGPDMVNEYAVNFIAKNKNRPFFLYYPMILPHSPFAPSPLSRDGDKSGAKISEVKYFKDMVEYIDVLVGNIIKALDENGCRDNTILVFTGDNGTTYPVNITKPSSPEFKGFVQGAKGGRFTHLFDPDAEPDPNKEGPVTRTDHGLIPGGKDLMTDAGTHVPMIADWPRHRANYGNHVRDDLVDFSDFLVTICEAGGATVPDDRTTDGTSFLPALRGEENPKARQWIFCHYWEFGRKKDGARDSVHNANWKLYDNGDFFDLSKDILEQHPLADGDLRPDALKTKMRFMKIRKHLRDDLTGKPSIGLTLADRLAHVKAARKKTGKPYKEAQETRFFKAKDTNNDGVWSASEAKTKPPKDWNKH